MNVIMSTVCTPGLPFYIYHTVYIVFWLFTQIILYFVVWQNRIEFNRIIIKT